MYEANPIALLMEQAGGAATDGKSAILDLAPGALHERCPLIFGAAEEVRRVSAAYAAPQAQRLPLFNRRSLFRDSPAVAERQA